MIVTVALDWGFPCILFWTGSVNLLLIDAKMLTVWFYTCLGLLAPANRRIFHRFRRFRNFTVQHNPFWHLFSDPSENMKLFWEKLSVLEKQICKNARIFKFLCCGSSLWAVEMPMMTNCPLQEDTAETAQSERTIHMDHHVRSEHQILRPFLTRQVPHGTICGCV